jgi:hypothetical protein
MTAGQIFWFDNVHILASEVQVMIDWLNPSFGGTAAAGGNDFSDVTWAVRKDIGVSMSHGRQDAVSNVQAGSAAFTLQNEGAYAGWFTAQCANSPWYPNVALQRRVQINVTDQTGAWHTRFDGNVAQLDYSLDVTGNTNDTLVTATDVLAYLNREVSLSCLTKEIILGNPSLQYHWTLDDQGTVLSCGESSGHGGPPLLGRAYGASYGTAKSTLTLSSGSCGVETQADSLIFVAQGHPTSYPPGPFTSPISVPSWVAQLADQTSAGTYVGNTGYGLTAKIAAIPTATQSFTAECWIQPSIYMPIDTPPYGTDPVCGPFICLSLGNSYDQSCLNIGIWQSTLTGVLTGTGVNYWKVRAVQYAAPPGQTVSSGYGLPSEVAFIDGPNGLNNYQIPLNTTDIANHHFVASVVASTGGATLTLYDNNVALGTMVLPAGQVYDTVMVGSSYGGYGCFYGSIGLVSIYNAAFSSIDVNTNFAVGTVGYQGTPTDSAVGALATLAKVPSYWDNTSKPVIVDETDGSVVFSGWYAGGGNGNPYGGSTQYIAAAGATCTFTFTGTRVAIVGPVRNDHGAASVVIDGGSPVTVSFFSNSALDQQIIATFGGLTNTSHTMVITALATGPFVEIDAFIVNYGAGLSLVDYFSTDGITPLACMQSVEGAEAGLLFADVTGRLTFHTRDWRMGYRAPAQVFPATSANVSLGYKLDDQFVTNDYTVSDSAGAFNIEITNLQSTSPHGDYSRSGQWPINILSSGYALFGLNDNALWPDDLVTLAHWYTQADSGSALRPASVAIDLLSPDTATPSISAVYAIDIDSMISLTGMPASMSLDSAALEYFVEGIQETISLTKREVLFYTSGASTSRAWIPGDATYGVLGTTATVGVSQYETHAVPAYGKQVPSEPGPPYWPTAVSTTMNNPALNGHGFVGERDIKGITEPLRTVLSPPLFVASVRAHVMAYTSLQPSAPVGQLLYDTVFVDNTEGMGAVPNWPSWYLVTVPGYYDIDASVVFASAVSGLAWMVVENAEVQAIRYGLGNPTNSTATCWSVTGASGYNTVQSLSTRLYLGLGDMVTVGVWQASTVGLALANGGSMMSLRWTGLSTMGDRFG